MDVSGFTPPRILFQPLPPNRTDLLRQFLYLAIHVPNGKPLPVEIIDTDPVIKRYWDGFGSRKGDIGVMAVNTETSEVIGCAWGRALPKTESGYGYLADDIPEVGLALLPEWQRQGIGTMLLRTLLTTYASDKNAPNGVGWQQVSLSTAKSNKVAQRVYENLDFHLIKEDAAGDLLMAVSLNQYRTD